MDVSVLGILHENDNLFSALGIPRSKWHLPSVTKEAAHIGMHESDSHPSAGQADSHGLMGAEAEILAGCRVDQFLKLGGDCCYLTKGASGHNLVGDMCHFRGVGGDRGRSFT